MSTTAFSVWYDEHDQQVHLKGALQPVGPGPETRAVEEAISRGAASPGKVLYIAAKRLTALNTMGLQMLACTLQKVARENPGKKFRVVTTSVIPWSYPRLAPLQQLHENILVETYDQDFYPGQSLFEDGAFVSALRAQTKMTWRHEKSLVEGILKPGAAVADICCGIGDFAMHLKKTFSPGRLVAVDHAKRSLDYARAMAEEFGVDGIEFQVGDAASLLLPDDTFDVVFCRHSLQVFDRPMEILSEIVRICKPGGTVYVTNEKNSHCLGEPFGESIQWTYNQVALIWAHFKMDIELGPKQKAMMMASGLQDVRNVQFVVSTEDDGGHPRVREEFAEVIRSWEESYCRWASKKGSDGNYLDRLRQGFRDHQQAILRPNGYATWPVWAGIGKKPQRGT